MSRTLLSKSKSGQCAVGQLFKSSDQNNLNKINKNLLRSDTPHLPECSELDTVRHFTKLSQKNFSIDTQFYPLGSCTMKYNPKGVHKAAMLDGFLNTHPLAPDSAQQGTLKCLYNLQTILADITGFDAVSLNPMAGAQGELAGVLMIKAYHDSRQDFERTEMLVPDAAHGTNPASAVMCGYKIKEIPTDPNTGDVDFKALKSILGPKTAGIMLTNPSTLGVFERNILEISKAVHEAGGLLYYDGANLNAIMGKARPGDMGFDVMHMNLHKTFATPHGGGGPGAGPIAVNHKLKPFLPTPHINYSQNNNSYFWDQNIPESIGQLNGFYGNIGVLLRAYAYILMLGKTGIKSVSEYATLNANYLMKELEKIGYKLAFKDRFATHEFILTLSDEKKEYNITAMDLAKRLLDFDIHAPTTYFPLLISECLLIEPTETESKQTLDEFIQVMKIIKEEMVNHPEQLKSAPVSLPVKRLDDVKAVKELDVVEKICDKTC